MKVIISSKDDNLRNFFNDDSLVTTKMLPDHSVTFVQDSGVDAFVTVKLKLGFCCVILKADSFVYNELVPRTITWNDLTN